MSRDRVEFPNSRVLSIAATVDRPTRYVIKYGDETHELYSTSLLIQDILLARMVYEAIVDIETAPQSTEIHRVQVHMVGEHLKAWPPGKYNMNAIATQRKPDGSNEHLEVFIDGLAASRNAYDPRVQQLLMGIFGYLRNASTVLYFDATFDEDKVTSVTFPSKGP
jgi:hypothetical protein